MNATAIYSKSGKGVQEASGKTSHLSRPDRAVLSAIDGRATLADVAQKVGKTYDATFQKLIESLDKGGFIREVSPGTAAPASKGAASAKPAGGAPADLGEDLDFTAAMSTPSKKPMPPPQAGPKPAPPPPKINVPPPPPPPSATEKKKAEDVAKQQQDTFAKAREEAERKKQEERDRLKAESEAKVRAETETKLRAEAEAKAKAEASAKLAAEAEAKIKAAQEAAARVAAEAKAKAEAEARKAREEAERVRREAEEVRRKAEEQAERVRKEAEEKLRREQEEMKRKLEAERKAREEAERKAKEEARRLEEERRKLEEERRKEEEERAARRKREEEEEAARRAERKKREEEEEARAEAERVARRQREEEEEARERAERKKRQEEEEARQSAEKAMRDARLRAVEREEEKEKEAEEEEEEEKPKAKKKKEKAKERDPEPEVAKPAGGGGFSDTLLADLDSFNTREETEQKEREEAERKRKEAEVRRRLEEEERKAKEEAARKEREEKERIKREAQEAKQREEAELKDRQREEEQRLKDEEEKRKKEAEERERKSRQDEQLAAKATGGRAGDAFAAEAELKKRRERQLGKVHRDPKLEQEKKGWGKPIAVTLFLLLAIGVGVAHVMPIAVEDYERGATDALGQPVRITSANLSLYSGLQLKFSGVSVGDTKIATVRAFPEIGALTGPSKAFSRIEIEGLKLPQSEVGGAMFAKLKADGFRTERLVFTKLDLTGPLALSKGLEVDLQYDGEGVVRQATVRGPEALLVRVTPKGGNAAEFEMSASSFTLPFASEISMSKVGAKGTLTPQGLNVSEWEGSILNGTVSGTANLRFGDVWVVNGVVTARGINAAVFAPALLSDGRAEGSGKFALRGNEAAKLASEGRLDGSFTVSRGVLGSIDLSRAIQTGGKQATGRTQFNEMNGQATYDRGQIQLRNIQLTAGQLNAGASVDISQSGALSGRIVADVKVASQTLKANLNLGGTLKEPQVRN